MNRSPDAPRTDDKCGRINTGNNDWQTVAARVNKQQASFIDYTSYFTYTLCRRMEDRKARLAALAAKAGRSNPNDSHNTDDTITDDQDTAVTTFAADDVRHHPDGHTARKKRKINFRNYIPSDPTLLPSNNDESNNVDGDEDATATAPNPTSNAVPQHPPVPTHTPNAASTTLQQSTAAAQGVVTQMKTTKSVLQLALEQARLEIQSAGSQASPLGNHPPANHMVSPHHNNNNINKINADLKRNCQSKLRLLEKRTQTALVSILRERLEQEASTTTTAK